MKSTIVLTATARREAERNGLGERLSALAPDACMMKGDFIDVPAAAGTVSFVIRSRRLVVVPDGGAHVLVFELDYPARPPQRR